MTDLQGVKISTFVLFDRKEGFVDIYYTKRQEKKRKFLEGAIVLEVNGRNVIDKSLWDDIEFIWYELVDMTVDFIEHGKGKMEFPDQPISANIRKVKGGLVRLEVSAWDGKIISSSSALESDYLYALKNEGPKALRRLSEINISNIELNEQAIEKLHRIL